jgi:hypothetical protein
VSVGIGVALALAVAVAWLATGDDAPADDPTATAAVEVPRDRAPRRAESVDAPPRREPAPPEPEAVVACALPAEAAVAGAAQVHGVPWIGPRRGHLAVREGRIELPLPKPDGQGGWRLRRSRRDEPAPVLHAGDPVDGTLDVPGVGRLPLRLDTRAEPWTCTVGALVRYAAVSGRVRLKRPEDGDHVEIVGCGTRTPVDGDGGFFLELPPEPCELRAIRRDGAFLARSEPVVVEPGSGEELVLDLSLPTWRAAGVGTQVANDPDGIRLEKVFPGTPAEAAGLRAGDVVVALDGEDVAGLDVNAFVDVAVGPSGSEVTYTVLRDGEEVDVTMERAEMDAPSR